MIQYISDKLHILIFYYILVQIQSIIPDILYTYMVLIISVLCPIFVFILCPPSGDIALRIIADQPVGSDGCAAQHPFPRYSRPG